MKNQKNENTFEVVQLEERLEMVQADTIIALASCCMDSKDSEEEAGE